jgi:hypothetical protein
MLVLKNSGDGGRCYSELKIERDGNTLRFSGVSSLKSVVLNQEQIIALVVNLDIWLKQQPRPEVEGGISGSI